MRYLFLLLILITASANSQADEPPSTAQVGLLAASCANCHGTDGQGTTILPPLAGRPAEVLEIQLLGFKHDELTRATVMDRIARGYSDIELKALADWFANIEAP